MSYKSQRENAAYDLATAIDDLIHIELKLGLPDEDRDRVGDLADEILKFMEQWERAR